MIDSLTVIPIGKHTPEATEGIPYVTDNRTTRYQLSSEQFQKLIERVDTEFILLSSHATVVTRDLLTTVIEQYQVSGKAAFILIAEGPLLVLDFCRALPVQITNLVLPLGGATHCLLKTESARELHTDSNAGQPFWLTITDLALQNRCKKAALNLVLKSALPCDFDAADLPELAPRTVEQTSLVNKIRNLKPVDLIDKITSFDDAAALKSGLLQWHGALDESHTISQSVQGKGRHAAGDYWHAIMHRSEPDPANSKYWYHKVGSHPVFPLLTKFTGQLLVQGDGNNPGLLDQLAPGGKWDPFAFIDFTEKCRSGANQTEIRVAKQIQAAEMLLLLMQTYIDATE